MIILVHEVLVYGKCFLILQYLTQDFEAETIHYIVLCKIVSQNISEYFIACFMEALVPVLRILDLLVLAKC